MEKFISTVYAKTYSRPDEPINFDQTIVKNGKTYIYLGRSEKRYYGGDRVKRGIYAIAKTVFFLGLGLISQKTRSDWKVFFEGKKIVDMYSSNPYWPVKILADKGCSVAQAALGDMYYEGKEVRQSYTIAFEHYLLAAKGGHVHAAVQLGYMYLYGEGVRSSFKESFNWFRQASDKGDSTALYELGRFYERGHGVEASLEEANKYYSLAADKGHPLAHSIVKNAPFNAVQWVLQDR